MTLPLNLGAHVYISDLPQNSTLSIPDYFGLDWTEASNVARLGNTGYEQTTRKRKRFRQPPLVLKSAAIARDWEIPILNEESDGKAIFDTAGGINNHDAYAIKIVFEDGRIEFSRNIITAPQNQNGAAEDVRQVIYTLSPVQMVQHSHVSETPEV